MGAQAREACDQAGVVRAVIGWRDPSVWLPQRARMCDTRRMTYTPSFARGMAFALPPSLAFWALIVWLIAR